MTLDNTLFAHVGFFPVFAFRTRKIVKRRLICPSTQSADTCHSFFKPLKRNFLDKRVIHEPGRKKLNNFSRALKTLLPLEVIAQEIWIMVYTQTGKYSDAKGVSHILTGHHFETFSLLNHTVSKIARRQTSQVYISKIMQLRTAIFRQTLLWQANSISCNSHLVVYAISTAYKYYEVLSC